MMLIQVYLPNFVSKYYQNLNLTSYFQPILHVYNQYFVPVNTDELY